jgi:hypothetical protein
MTVNFTYLRNGAYLATLAGDFNAAYDILKDVKASGIVKGGGYSLSTKGYVNSFQIEAIRTKLKKD